MAVQYAPLFSLETQFQAKDGSNNTAGWLKVYLAATDDPADTYSDYLGTRNPEKIVLDDNGRAVVICDKSKAYRLEVYDADGMLLWTEEPVYCSGTGGGGVSVTEVVSTDGSIAVESSVAGSMRTYDVSIAPDNAKELLEWAKCSNTVDSDGYVYPLYGEGTMQTQAGKGLEVFKDRYYHLTNKITVIPSANGINYETITVQVMHDDNNGTVVSLASHDFDIDNSVSDKVELEFSEDIIPEEDGFLLWRVTGRAPFNTVGLDMQIHRIYSGINAVPGSIASKPWVAQNISSKIDYSALEYNQQNLITGISGSAIASNAVDPNEFIPWSASGTFQPSGDYLTASASSLFQPSGDYLTASASSLFQPSGEYLTATASALFQPSGNYVYESAFSSYSSVIDNSISAISSVVSGVSSTYIEKTASGMFQPSGNYVSSTDMSAYAKASSLEDYQLKSAMSAYAYESSLSSKLDSSAFSAVSGTFLTAVPEGYATESYVDSGLSGKLDVTASSQFITSLPTDLATTADVASAVSGKLDASAYDSAWFQPASSMSAWIPYSALDYSGTAISGIGGSSLAGRGGADYSGVTPVSVDNDARLISVNHRTLCVDETLTAYDSGSSAVLGVNTVSIDLPAYQRTAEMTAYQPAGIYIYESALGWEEV